MSEREKTSLGHVRETITQWHGWLRGTVSEDGSDAPRKGNTAALAELRRCADARDVMLTWPFGRLVRLAFPAVEFSGVESLSRDDIAALAHTALIMSCAERAGAKPPTFGRVPRLMAQIPEGGRAPVVGRVRANVLLSSPDADEACRSILSVMPLLGDGKPTLDPGHLYHAMRRWDHVKTDWAMDYYAALPLDEKAGAA